MAEYKEYLESAMPKDRTSDSQKRLIGRFLGALKESGRIKSVGRKWIVQ